MWSVATGNSQGLSDQKPSHHGSSSSLASSACSIQSGCTEKAIDNLSMKDSILDGRYMIVFIMLIAASVLTVVCSYLAFVDTFRPLLIFDNNEVIVRGICCDTDAKQ